MAFFSDMKKENKVESKEIEKLPPQPEIATPSTVDKKIVINSFSGDFGRVDINLLRDKVNEIIDYLNK